MADTTLTALPSQTAPDEIADGTEVFREFKDVAQGKPQKSKKMAPETLESLQKQSIPQDKVDQFADLLERRTREPKKISVLEMVEGLYPKITRALDNGYSFKEISSLLKEVGLNVSPTRLKQGYKVMASKYTN